MEYTDFVYECPSCTNKFCPECLKRDGVTFSCSDCSSQRVGNDDIVGEIKS